MDWLIGCRDGQKDEPCGCVIPLLEFTQPRNHIFDQPCAQLGFIVAEWWRNRGELLLLHCCCFWWQIYEVSSRSHALITDVLRAVASHITRSLGNSAWKRRKNIADSESFTSRTVLYRLWHHKRDTLTPQDHWLKMLTLDATTGVEASLFSKRTGSRPM